MPRLRFRPRPRLCPVCLGLRFRPVPRLCPLCLGLRFRPVPRLCPLCSASGSGQSPVCARYASASGSGQSPVCARYASASGSGQSPVCARYASASGSGQSPVCARYASASGSGQSPVCARYASASGSGQSPVCARYASASGSGQSPVCARYASGSGQSPVCARYASGPAMQFQLREPVSVSSVAATCDENMVHVQVKKDLFGSGELIRASDISLGGCGVTGEDSVAQLLYFQSYLQACGSQVVMTNDTLVYSFSLTYLPTAASNTSAPIVRTSGAVIGIECHYLRLHNVSSNALQPAWIPYAATKIAQELLVFSLKLMTDDWQFERPSNVYYMGDLIHFEASVKQYNHVPLRVFVDSCQVTPYPYAASAPSYLFIQNHGCLVDSKLTGSSSRFLPRTQDFKLQFQLEAFRFQQGDTGSLYITCVLKATAAASPTDAEHKACSFVGQKWAGAGGEDQLCSCCDGTCGSRKARDLTSVSGM
uniref:Zona pellucida sperm-binding protein 3 n=1 Tax=Denticeps clupeoides TaxID=299321 RepID=A0AAY4BKM4_9TELE